MKPKLPRIILLLLLTTIAQSVSAQCNALTLPYTENFSAVSLGSSCSWTASTVASGAGWTMATPAYAGSTAPEAKAYGNNACAGCVQTISLTLTSPLNTTTVTSLQLSFLHKLYVTNQGTSGSGSGTLVFQTSTDGITWVNRWSTPYTVSGTALTPILSGTVNVPTFNPSSNETYIRFAITGVMFKVWGWLIDDISASSPITTSIKDTELQAFVNVWPNPAINQLNIETEFKGNLKTQLYNINGEVVKELTLNKTFNTIDINELAPGIYFVRLTTESGLSNIVKFVKS